MALRKTSPIQWEAALAELSQAGVRILKQATVSASGTSEGTYTVTEGPTRRVAARVVGGADGDVRFALNETADANSWPLADAEDFRVDAEEGDVLHFFNTTGSSVDVFLLELA